MIYFISGFEYYVNFFSITTTIKHKSDFKVQQKVSINQKVSFEPDMMHTLCI